MTIPGRREALETPSTLEAARGLGMVYGGPLAVALWWAGSLVSAAARATGARRGRVGAAITVGGLVTPWLYYLVLRPRWLSWGAAPDEIAEPLPGDDIVPTPTGTSTRAVTIEASAEEVWRWLVQVGYGRGGWYSYDALEAAAGAGDFVEGRSATRIHPELQDLAVGDVIPMSPWTAVEVAGLDAPRSMVLAGRERSALMPPSSWAFVLRPIGANRTRLIVRGRSGGASGAWLHGASAHLLEAPHFVMERKMMLGLKERAELAWRARWQPWQIDRILPDTEFRDEIDVGVHAPGDRILQAVKEVTLREVPAARLLGEVRDLPGWLLGRAPTGAALSEPFSEGLSRGGWVTLAEDPGRELVWGGAGKYHQLLDREPQPFSRAEEFLAFDHPGCEKLAISVRVEPGARAHERRLVLEHRTHPLSDEARRRFGRSWRLIKPAGALAARQLLLAAKRRAESA
jgi:hypothetical protein